MRIEKLDKRKAALYVILATGALWLITFAVCVAGADVLWSRLKGQVKAINYKTAAITIQNPDGDLLTLKVDEDVTIKVGKEERPLKDVKLDDRVVLVNAPRAPKPKDADEPPVGGVYK